MLPILSSIVQKQQKNLHWKPNQCTFRAPGLPSSRICVAVRVWPDLEKSQTVEQCQSYLCSTLNRCSVSIVPLLWEPKVYYKRCTIHDSNPGYLMSSTKTRDTLSVNQLLVSRYFFCMNIFRGGHFKETSLGTSSRSDTKWGKLGFSWSSVWSAIHQIQADQLVNGDCFWPNTGIACMYYLRKGRNAHFGNTIISQVQVVETPTLCML